MPSAFQRRRCEAGHEVNPLSLKLRFQPADDGLFLWACEANGFGGFVAAILDDLIRRWPTRKQSLK
jgi:hypothetical protein